MFKRHTTQLLTAGNSLFELGWASCMFQSWHERFKTIGLVEISVFRVSAIFLGIKNETFNAPFVPHVDLQDIKV